MEIQINPFIKRDGGIMLFVNNDRRVSFGINCNGRTTPFYKRTKGEKNLTEAFYELVVELFDCYGDDFTGDIASHTEPKSKLDNNWHLLFTDVCNLGGHKVGSDGAYLVRNGKVLSVSDINAVLGGEEPEDVFGVNDDDDDQPDNAFAAVTELDADAYADDDDAQPAIADSDASAATQLELF